MNQFSNQKIFNHSPLYNLLYQYGMTETNSKHVHIITDPIQLTWLTNDGFIRPNAKEENFSLLF